MIEDREGVEPSTRRESILYDPGEMDRAALANSLKPTLGICAIFRNEAPYLREWVEFHRLVGVDRFYLYDNGSTDEWYYEIDEHVDNGTVRVASWPGEAQQLDAYWDALRSYAGGVRWLAFLDIDEFLFSPTGERLPTILDGVDREIAAIGACWYVYGTGGVERRSAPVTQSYLWRSRDPQLGRHVKSIIRTSRALAIRPLDPHHFEVVGRSVDELGRDLQGPLAQSQTGELLRVNHYISKSKEEARAKMRRPRADSGALRDMDLLADELNDLLDLTILTYSRKLAGRL